MEQKPIAKKQRRRARRKNTQSNRTRTSFAKHIAYMSSQCFVCTFPSNDGIFCSCFARCSLVFVLAFTVCRIGLCRLKYNIFHIDRSLAGFSLPRLAYDFRIILRITFRNHRHHESISTECNRARESYFQSKRQHSSHMIISMTNTEQTNE